ncbi:uncharacterized protein LOC124663359 [Lolium rigidum]|uniref:uncharacterized protein LOC124663263 n=1 Tax=Lolium rigidum TaxID=89674 RepID=UPI001F5D1F3D|nr:uncharacterized protein LOC124663263 [Lolium rigidum]XP_047057028.1 uncharacterized protein LOC124663359 [Lolium rigidum]
MASPSAPAPPWVILGSIPRVAAPDDGSDVSVALTAPPRVSILTVSPRVFPDPPTPHFFPFVLAADPSGLLLLQANLQCAPTRQVIDRPDHQSVTWKDTNARYFVLDATTGSAFHLPDPQATIMHQALLGLVVSPGGGGHYMVAELQPIIGSSTATLLCFSTEVGEWVEKSVHYPLPPRPLSPICVLSHHGRLWWIDLSWGVITCDPFADEPVLGFVPFPPGKVLACREAKGLTDMFRCVGVSGGKLRFVDTYMDRRRAHAGGPIPTVGVWTLADPDSTEWTLEHEASFTEIWADQSYKATGLPNKVPRLALIHPKKPDVLYFFLQERLFGVDVPARKVVVCEVYGLVAPPSCCIATRFVRSWELPRALSSGNWSDGINLAEESYARPYRPSPEDYHMVGSLRQTFIG